MSNFNQKLYVSNCKTGIVVKNNSYFESQSFATVSGCIESGVMVFNNSTLNCSRNNYSTVDAGDYYNLTVTNCPVGIIISNNSVGNIKCYCTSIDIGAIFNDNSTGEVWFSTFLSDTNKSGKFYSAVYVQNSNVMLREMKDTSGWGSLTASTGPTNYRVNGGVIYVVTDEGLASPGISDISVGPQGGKVVGINTAYTNATFDILDKINTDQYYYQKMS